MIIFFKGLRYAFIELPFIFCYYRVKGVSVVRVIVNVIC